MTNRAPFKHKQGRSYKQGRKLQGRQIDGGGCEGAILHLCSRAPKLMTHWAPLRPLGYAPGYTPCPVFPSGLCTIYRAHIIGSNHWVHITTWTPWGQKIILQPTIFCRNPSLSKSHPHRICSFCTRTLSAWLESSVDDQSNQ